MKRVSIYFVRHGQTTANAEGRLQGRCDYPLTELGVNQAKQVGACLSQIEFSSIFSSDLKRAFNTCKLILGENHFFKNKDDEKINEIVNLSSDLREIGFGIRENLPRFTSIDDALKIVSERDGVAIQDIVDDSEPKEETAKRQKSFLNALRNASGPVLAVSHGAYVRMFMNNFSKQQVKRIGNCSVSIVEVEFKIDDDKSEPIVHIDLDLIGIDKHMDIEDGHVADKDFRITHPFVLKDRVTQEA